ncbi:MAG: hypothetical protein E7658_08235 [Ruminococcaceae bacterium]|nr:hypothetical protein [Oscillospiraceae bacterium]
MRFRIGPMFAGLCFLLLLLDRTAYPLSLAAAVCIHEGGHLLAAWLCGAKCRSFRLGITGLSLDFDCGGLSYGRECLIQLAGSCFGMLSVWIAACFGERTAYYCVCALCLNIVNLLPITGLDGGGILSSLLHMCLEDGAAVRICRGVSLLTAVFLWVCALWISLRTEGNLTVLLCGGFFLVKSLLAYGMPKGNKQ